MATATARIPVLVTEAEKAQIVKKPEQPESQPEST